MTTPSLAQHLAQNAQQQPAVQIPPEVQALLNNPPPGMDPNAVLAYYGQQTQAAPQPVPQGQAAQAMPQAAQAVPQAVPQPAPQPQPVDPRTNEQKAPLKRERKPRSDKGKPRGPRKTDETSTAVELVFTCARAGLEPGQAQEYVDVLETVTNNED